MRQIALARHVYRLCPEFILSKKLPKLPGDLQGICREFNDGRGPGESYWFNGHILLRPSYPRYLYGEAVDARIKDATSSLRVGSVLLFPPKAA